MSVDSGTLTDQEVQLLILVTNSYNEVLLMRTVDDDGKIKDKWVCMQCGLPKGESIDLCIKKYVKRSTQMEVESIESIEPFEEIIRDKERIIAHRIKMGFRAMSTGDITELGPHLKTAGWFTKQEIEWYWDKIDEDTRKVLMASRYIQGMESC
jgi:hypothetical protein